MVSPRKLRSKDTTNNNSTLLYDFDNINEYISNDKPIGITKKASDNHYSWFGIMNKPLPTKQIDIIEIDQILPRRVQIDPLPSSKYEIFHRKMRKDEKQMINEEKDRNFYELDILTSELQTLNQYNWEKRLCQITKVNDPRDTSELELKKQLTINEIEKILRKSENWRKRNDLFNNKFKNYVRKETDESDEDYDLPLEEVKLKRKNERRLKYGPKVKLNLGNDLCLIIDPFGIPKIVKGHAAITKSKTQSPRKIVREMPKSKPKEVIKKEVHVPIESFKQKSIKLENVTKDMKIDFKNSGDEVLFGTLSNNLPTFANGFQLPLNVRRAKK
ncbi:unnamed protein product [Candida verbasci]|uniref:Something about silencing protein 4 domain-containing protein n=1 Tax=Candida verbasci TaxID=1227364 RepID=A0A9W4XHT6_9ASCO|nr:unnamed protein product [Candida verbasci]